MDINNNLKYYYVVTFYIPQYSSQVLHIFFPSKYTSNRHPVLKQTTTDMRESIP